MNFINMLNEKTYLWLPTCRALLRLDYVPHPASKWTVAL